MELSRKKFLTMFGALGVASTVPQAMGKGEGIEKYLTTGPNPEKRHYPILNGWDNRPHYPVMENTFGEMGWEKKSPYEIVADINKGVAEVQKQSFGSFIPTKHSFLIGLPPSRTEFLQKEFCYGNTVEWYIRNCWPNAELWNHYLAAAFLEDSGYDGSAEFFVMCSAFRGSMGFIDKRTFAYSQYGI